MSTHYRPTLLLHRCRLMLLCLLALAFQPLTARSAQSATTRYVDGPTGNNSGDCTGQSAPCKTIQYAVNQAQNGDTILVTGSANGTHYTYSSATEVCTDRIGVTGVVCFINKQLTLLGGYALNNWATANPAANLTIIDGENRIRGVMLLNFRSTTTLHMQGFTVQNGLSRGNPKGNGDAKIFSFGGGMFLDGIQVLILKHMIFQNNRTIAEDVGTYGGSASGGGLAVAAVANVTLEDILFDNNLAQGGSGSERGGYGLGGGLYVLDSNVTGSTLTAINNRSLGGNTSGSGRTSDGQRGDALGAGINFQGGDGKLQFVYVADNHAIGGNATTYSGGGFGGGVRSENGFLTLTDATVRDNIARGGAAENGWLGNGGGVETIDTQLTLERVRILNNSAQGGTGSNGDKGAAGGGGVNVSWSNPKYTAKLTMINTLVANNRALNGPGQRETGGGGGGVWLQAAEGSLQHVTIANNTVERIMQGQAILLIEVGDRKANATIANSILADHTGFGQGVAALHVKPGNSVTLQGLLNSNNGKITNADGQPDASGQFSGLETVKTGAASFVAPAAPTFDYHLASDSAAIDQANPSSVTNDMDQQSRPAVKPDLGADEYSPPPTDFIYLPMIRR